ncbi:hypothetical protein V6D40_05325 [Corynebacterium sp. Q4381]|uniref:hypothetical protein n=1 Tax=Corynebacterium sp. Marseille-Q4381 TaxID=3121597 RepID=UPI002FE63345
MDLTLTTHTAPTARRLIPQHTPLPAATLSPSRTAAAHARRFTKEQLLIDAHLTSLTAHLESVAAFATRVERIDDALARTLDRALTKGRTP